MNLEDILKNYRSKENLSMQEFANRCGLSKGYISMLEKGKHPQSNRPLVPSISTLNSLACGMNITIDVLLSMMNADSLISVNDPSPNEFDLTYNEQALIRDYRDSSPEIREAAAVMLHDSAERNREDKKRKSGSAG